MNLYKVTVPVAADSPDEAARTLIEALGADENSINDIGGIEVTPCPGPKRRVGLALATVAALLLGLTACSSGGDSEEKAAPVSATPSESPIAPECSEVWVAGETLDTDYKGCLDGGTLEGASSFRCGEGPNLFQHGSDFWAFGGQEIHEEPGGAANATAYSNAYNDCRN